MYSKIITEIKTEVKAVKDNKASAALAPLKGVLLAYAITAVIFIVYALLLTYTQLSEKNNNAVVLITPVIALIAGGIKSAVSAKQRGLLWGVLTGVLYVAVMSVMGLLLLPDYSVGSKTLVCFLLGIGSGGLGGIIGVNFFAGK